jgi:hypothetical protein
MRRKQYESINPQLPEAPVGELKDYLDQFRQRLEEKFAQIETPGLVRAHEFYMVQPPRHGSGLSVGSMYADQDGIVRIVESNEMWMEPVVLTVRIGAATAV